MQKYEVLGFLGQGAYGLVLKCRNKENQEIVAIKKFKGSEEDESIKKTILREVKVLRLLKQDNIVKLKEAFRRKGKLYIVLEYVEKNLLELLEERPTGFDPDTTKRLIYQLCQAIAYCHSLDIVHRDIKPENLLISENQILKLCDFGFARTINNNFDLTDYVATRWYRSPEQLIGCDYGKGADIWAIGCILAEMTDGQPLFAGMNQMDQLYLIQKTLGQLKADEQEEFFRKNPQFVGMKFHEITKPTSLEEKFQNKMGNQTLKFLKLLLQMDQKKRPTAIEVLEHPYFDGIRDELFCNSLKDQKNYDRLQSGNKQIKIQQSQQNQMKESRIKNEKPQSNNNFINYLQQPTQQIITNNQERLNNFTKNQKNQLDNKSLPKREGNSQLGFLQKNQIIGNQDLNYEIYTNNFVKQAQNYNYNIPEEDISNEWSKIKQQQNIRVKNQKKSFGYDQQEEYDKSPQLSSKISNQILIKTKKHPIKNQEQLIQHQSLVNKQKGSKAIKHGIGFGVSTDEQLNEDGEVYQSNATIINGKNKNNINNPYIWDQKQQQEDVMLNNYQCNNFILPHNQNVNVIYNNLTYNYNINPSPGWIQKKKL